MLTHEALLRAYDEAYQVLRSVAQEKRVGLLDLAKELNGQSELFIDSVHLSAKGSEEVAKRVADFLASDFQTRNQVGHENVLHNRFILRCNIRGDAVENIFVNQRTSTNYDPTF